MNQITDYLWIADISTVREKSVPTDVVVTVCQDRVDDNIGCQYEFFNMADGEAADIYGGSADYELFERAVDATLLHIEQDRSVLVHCHMGRSRSASVCIAVVAMVEEIEDWEAYGLVKDARPQITPDRKLHDHARRYVREN